MGTGYLVVETTTARGNIILHNSAVTISGELLSQPIVTQTGLHGSTGPIALPTPEIGKTDMPFSTFRVVVTKEGYVPITVDDIHVFDLETSYLPLSMVPIDYNLEQEKFQRGEDIHVSAAMGRVMPVQAPGPAIVRLPVIPRNITVHLGPPGSNDETVTVPFPYYIKNVASSEIFPTWPEESLRANIYAILSLTLNRVYTEWYRQRGYQFDITNNTAFDQKYTQNGQIFQSISNIVDDIFNEYIVKENHIEPLFAAYCDGKELTNCVGLKQWGTVDYAKQGLNALEILKQYYGDDIEIVETNRIEDVTDSYPGRVLQLGSGGHNVYTMQRFLNRISINYPSIPRIRPVNGVFDIITEEAVKEFQRIFLLPVDGKIGKNTWYKIAFIYNSVRKLSELGEEGERLPKDQLYFRRTLRPGMRGEDVDILQYALNVVSEFYSTVPNVAMDSRFGQGTLDAVKAYQETFGLDVDGIVGRYTWNHLMTKMETLRAKIPLRNELVQYPGYILRTGTKSDAVRSMQAYLNEIAVHYPQIPRLRADGFFGEATKNQVIAFQRLFDLNPDGIVGPITWGKLLDIYVKTLNVVPYPGFELFEGDRNQFVSIMQTYLNDISQFYPAIPYAVVDEAFGPQTKQAVQAFQRQFGLTPDGIVGRQTWDKVVEVYLSTSTNAPISAAVAHIMDKSKGMNRL